MKKRGVPTKLLLLLCSSVLSLLLLETAFRFYVFGWDSLSIERVNSVRPIGVSGILQESPYAEIIFELKPNLSTYHKLAKFETNSQGLRDKEYSIMRTNGSARVAVVGDSYTMPAGVEIEDAYHSVLEEMFNEKRNGTTYEFINFGVGGYNLRQYLGVMVHKVIEYEPDLILIGFCANDSEIPPREIFQTPFTEKQTRRPFLQSFVVRELEHALQKWTRKPPRVPLTERVSYMRDMFAKMGSYSRNFGIPIVIAPLVTEPMEWEDLLGDLAKENGLHLVDVGSAFRGLEDVDFKIYATDRHPNAEAHEIFAQSILEYLNANGLLDSD